MPQPEVAGPPLPPPASEPAPAYGPEPVTVRPITLVLGPGMARGFAYVGAIRALNEAKIPIGAVLGTEFGALIGSIYSMDGKINQFEWAMLKFKDDVFAPKKGFLSFFDKAAKTRKFEADLEKVFEKKDLSQAALPVRVAVQLKESGSATVLERGQAVAAVRAAMADPQLFEPASLNGMTAGSAAHARPFLISEARALGLGPVVVVDALDEQEERRFASAAELRDADLVIRPDLRGIGTMDFQKRTDAAFRGKKAVEAQLDELRRLTGQAREGASQKGTAP